MSGVGSPCQVSPEGEDPRAVGTGHALVQPISGRAGFPMAIRCDLCENVAVWVSNEDAYCAGCFASVVLHKLHDQGVIVDSVSIHHTQLRGDERGR